MQEKIRESRQELVTDTGNLEEQYNPQGRYAYEQLLPEEKTVYREVLLAVTQQKESVMVSTLDSNVLYKAYNYMKADFGGLFWVDGYTYTEYTSLTDMGKVTGLVFAPSYTMSMQERQEKQQEVEAAAAEFLQGMSEDASDYEKAKYVYDTLIRNVTYDSGVENNQNILSVFLKQATVCQGYACAAQYLLEQLDVPCTIISGTADGEPHAWNLVRLDGDYYWMDVTWGDSSYQNGQSGEEYIDYNYFAATTDEMKGTHVADDMLLVPECTAIADSYFVREGAFFVDWNPDEIGALCSRLSQGQVTMKFEDEMLYEKAMEYLIDECRLEDYYEGDGSVYYIQNDRLHTLLFLTK